MKSRHQNYHVFLVVIHFFAFFSSLFSYHYLHQSSKSIRVFIKPDHYLHGPLNVTQTHKAAFILSMIKTFINMLLSGKEDE